MYLVNFLNPQTVNQRFIAAVRFRTGVELLGAKDLVNSTYTVPFGDTFTHNLPFLTIQVYLNGQRLKLLDDYTVVESGGVGTGHDTVVLEISPHPDDKVTADYVATDGPP